MLSLALARDEVSRLFSRPILRIALVVITIIPLLYGAMYLWAFWDPYGNLDNIPVALVNLDEPAKAGDETLQAGSELVDSLLEKETFGWQVVSAEVAARGVKDGTYYSSLTIPKNFSASLATAEDDHPVRARLSVTMHESRSMITSQIEGKVFGAVREAASASASKGYYENVLLGFSDARNGLEEAADGANELADGLDAAYDGSGELSAGADDASAGGSELSAGLGELSSGAKKLAKGSDTLADGTQDLATGATQMADGTKLAAGGAGQVAQGAGDLAAGMKTLSAGAAVLSTSAAQLSAGAAQVDAGVASAQGKIGEAADGAAQVRDGLAGIKSYLAAYLSTHAEAGSDPDFMRAMGTASAVSTGAVALAAGLESAEGSAATLAAGAHLVATGARQLAAGASQLASGVVGAHAGAGTLAAGAMGVSNGTADLADGASALSAGAHSAADGAGEIADGSSALAAGLDDADAGGAELAVGLAALQDGSAELAHGLGDAADGSHELAGGLTAGIGDIPAYTEAQRLAHAQMMSDPVALDTKSLGEVPNYGTGFAPYFIPLSLWVGALIAFVIINPLPLKAVRSGKPAPIVALAGLWPVVPLAFAQSVLLYAVLRGGLGLAAVQPVALFGIVLVTAVVYTVIMQWLSVSFGPTGKLISILLLMLQLTSAAGTFPLEVLPGFFQAINPWLPMTYVVQGLREAISGGDMAVYARDVWTLLIFGFAAFVGTSYTARRARNWDPKRLQPMFEL